MNPDDGAGHAGDRDRPVRLARRPGRPPPLFAGLGGHHRPVTTASPDAQRYVDQGLNFLYAFNHDEAARAFDHAAALDPACAMAHWGAALARGPHINNPTLPPDRASAAWASVGRARERAAGGTPAERALVAALATRYADPPPADRRLLDEAYAAAMRDVWRRFPADPDAGALFAESVMDLRPWDQWAADGAPRPETPEVLAALEAVLELAPDHPLALHLYVHAVEASPEPGRAAAAADRLRHLAPGLGHLVHMPSHIDVRLGRWQAAPAEVLVRFGRWDEVLREPASAVRFPVARALRLAARGVALAAMKNPAAARAELAAFRAAAAAAPKDAAFGNNPATALFAVADALLEGELLVAEGRVGEGLAALRRAVEKEDALRYDEPPDWIHPVRHALGANLLKAGEPAEAERVYRDDLRRWPDNGWALVGLADSLKAQGRGPAAAEARDRFREAGKRADVPVSSSCFCQPGGR